MVADIAVSPPAARACRAASTSWWRSAGAAGGALSGMVVRRVESFAVLSLAGGFLALLLVPALLRIRSRNRTCGVA